MATKAKITQSEEDDSIEWDDPSISDLGKLLYDDVHSCFQDAIRKIAESGCTEDVAEKTVLRCGPFYGTEDTVTNIVDRALTCLRNENKEGDTSPFYMFENLHKLVEYTTTEMVVMVRSVKPSFSVSEAMWSLLICDLNVLQACNADLDPRKLSLGSKVDRGDGFSTKTQNRSEPDDQETDGNEPDVPKASNVKSSRPVMHLEDTCPGCRKGCLGNAHRLRQKQCHTHKGRVSKGIMKALTRGDFVVDRKEKTISLSGSSSGATKNTPPAQVTEPEGNGKPVKETAAAVSDPPKPMEYYLAGIPFDESRGVHVPRDDKDRTILAAVSRVQNLQNELKKWDDWVNVKVMQVAARLARDRAELNTLRAEKEDAERSKKDKEALEEATAKRLAEMTAALDAANGQVEMANAAVVRLEHENSIIKEQMEVARIASSREAKNVEKAMVKEEEVLKRFRSFGSEQKALEADLKALKAHLTPKLRELDKGKTVLSQTEAQLAHEESKTARLVHIAEAMRKERLRIEALGKAEEERIKKNAEKDLTKNENTIQRMKYDISAMKLESETKRIAGMKKGMKRLEAFQENFGSGSKKQDRECVMCLSEDQSVVLLPCAHQVLCAACNAIHEKNRMNECPSCRTPIQKRVLARFVD